MSHGINEAIGDQELWVEISIAQQCLWLRRGTEVLIETNISTATNGAGEQAGSEQTPRGWHKIRAAIGTGLPENSVFVGRRPTGEVYTESLGADNPDRDWVLSRILWLSGLEPGVNRLGKVDTMRRYIYLHGTPDSVSLGRPGSHGCVRMRNSDIMRLFDLVSVGTRVWLHE